MPRSRLALFALLALLIAGPAAAATKPAPAEAKPAASGVWYEIFVRSWVDTNGDGIGDLNGVTSSTAVGDQSSVSVGVPSTAPPTPSDVATSIFVRSPVSVSPVTSTPDFCDDTDSRITIDGSTHSG